MDDRISKAGLKDLLDEIKALEEALGGMEDEVSSTTGGAPGAKQTKPGVKT